MARILLILFFTHLLSCTHRNNAKIHETDQFQFPIVSQQINSIPIGDYNPKHVSDAFFKVATKSRKIDTLKFSVNLSRDTSISNNIDYHYHETDPSISYDGFEIHPDYPSTVYKNEFNSGKLFRYYPIYLVNDSKVDKHFPGKDSYAFGIQEALDSNGIWRPIEGRGFDFCGNGYWDLIVRPQEFLVILIPKYDGEYKTKIRIRLEVGDIIYVSKAYDAEINYNQFFVKKQSYFADCLEEDKTTAIQDLFYGSVPLNVSLKGIITHAAVAQQGQ